jgi:hypothetical protein
MIKKMFLAVITIWLPLAVVATGLMLLTYTAVQQDLRISANDPQIQMAEDAAARLQAGGSPFSEVPVDKVDIASSLSTFVSVYDSSRKLVAANVLLDQRQPDLPSGVLEYTAAHGQDRVTWQPRTGVRCAVVAVYYHGQSTGYVVVGRSLREVEKRVGNLGLLTGVAWVLILAASLVITLITAAATGWIRK